MYTTKNFKSKKALKEAVAAYNACIDNPLLPLAPAVRCYSPGPYSCPENGCIALEGPHYPEPHRWYAEAVVENGIVVKVK